MNTLFDRLQFWKTVVKREFISAVGQRAYAITHEGFDEFQKDMFEAKAFEYEAMQQTMDVEINREIRSLIEKNLFLEKRLLALKALDDKFMLVRSCQCNTF